MSHTWEMRKVPSTTLVCPAEGHLVWSIIISLCQEPVLEPPFSPWITHSYQFTCADSMDLSTAVALPPDWVRAQEKELLDEK